MNGESVGVANSADKTVHVDSFKKWLGRNFSVWEIYAQNTDHTGHCRIPLKEIAQQTDAPIETIKTRIKRLARRGVLEVVRARPPIKRVHCLYSDAKRETIFVPSVLINVIECPPGWGGFRAGAGRPASSCNVSNTIRKKSSEPQSGSDSEHRKESSEPQTPLPTQPKPPPKKSSEPLINVLSLIHSPKSSEPQKLGQADTASNLYPLKGVKAEIENAPLKGGILHARTRVHAYLRINLSRLTEKLIVNWDEIRGFFFLIKKKNHANDISLPITEFKQPQSPISLDPPKVVPPSSTNTHVQSLSISSQQVRAETRTARGIRLGGTGRNSTWHYEGVPAQPDRTLIPPLVVPPPPRIDSNWDEERQLAFFANTWTAAIEHRTGKPCWWLRHRHVGRGKKKRLVNGVDKHRDELLEAIALCIEYDLQPGPWIVFSFDEWKNALTKAEQRKLATKTKSRKRSRRKSPGAPPIKWVFSESRIQDRRGWYGHVLERELYRGSIRFTANHLKLIRKHTAMRFALLALSSPTKDDVDKIIDRFFPERYELLVRQCKDGIQREQKRLNTRANDGEWLWL